MMRFYGIRQDHIAKVQYGLKWILKSPLLFPLN
jgi:hypothetical protein